MWLINVIKLLNDITPCLDWVFDDAAQREGYAILSHTWGNEEVSFHKIDNLATAKQYRGFEKIRLTCEQAERDGLRYAWVDTCCIDKTSSAELTEAINSMFRWYQNSRICYAFLSDVDLQSDPASFSNTRWWSRGWTLQELLAPAHIRFYDMHWKYLGDRDDLAETIAKITTIDLDVLHKRARIADLSVAKRMSWAAKRDTTRIEDIAYCLLGLFGVNMPLLYGEGVKAFRRLQEEILKSTSDHTILLWSYDLYNVRTVGNARTLFAESPSWFAGSGAIVQIPRDEVAGFEVTQYGIRATLPLIEDRDGRIFVVLDARYEHDFTGPLVLYLGPVEHDAHNPSVKAYNINKYPVMTIQPLGIMEYVELEDIILLHDAPPTERKGGRYHIANFWFQDVGGFYDKFQLVEARPQERWNRDCGLMFWKPLLMENQSFPQGYVVWQSKDLTSSALLIAFKTLREGRTFSFKTSTFDKPPTEVECDRFVIDMKGWTKVGYFDSSLVTSTASWATGPSCKVQATFETRMGCVVAMFKMSASWTPAAPS